MRMHFCSRHVRDIMIILEEVNLPHPRCSRCDMLVPWQALNGRHHNTTMYRKGTERKRRWMAEKELRDSMERSFEAYRKPLVTVATFKYMGQVMSLGHGRQPTNVLAGLPDQGRAEELPCGGLPIRWDASDPAAISFPHSPHSTLSF